jgi:hypothetical protein
MLTKAPSQDPAAIDGLDDAQVVKSLQWDGVVYELRNHVDGWIVVIRSDEPAAAVYSLLEEAELALGLAAAEVILAAAQTSVRWNGDTEAGVASSADGTRWAMASIRNGVPRFTEHDGWDSAHLALADELDLMADGPVYTGSNLEDEIAQAHLRRAAAEVRTAVATAQLGDAMRKWQPHLQQGRLVARIARHLGVERKFLYRVFAGQEWRRRGKGRPAAKVPGQNWPAPGKDLTPGRVGSPRQTS